MDQPQEHNELHNIHPDAIVVDHDDEPEALRKPQHERESKFETPIVVLEKEKPNKDNSNEIIVIAEEDKIVDDADKIVDENDKNNFDSHSNLKHEEIVIIEEKKEIEVKNVKTHYERPKEPQVKFQKEEDKLFDNLHDKFNREIVFFFINPASGSKEGQHIIDMGVKKVEFVDGMKTSAFIFNLRDKGNYMEGVALIRSYQQQVPKSLPRVVIGGGDGTVLSMIEEFLSLGINVQNCQFGVLPLGTGNDLANSLGWGSSIDISSDMARFKQIVQEIVDASTVNLDVWELKLSVDENGGAIVQVVGQNGEKAFRKDDKSNKNVVEYRRSFINYFSLGYDARVGFGFDKSRTSSRCCNKCIYFWEGCKKSCCRKTLKVNGFIESFSTLKVDDNFFDSRHSAKDRQVEQEEIFRTKHAVEMGERNRQSNGVEGARSKTSASRNSTYKLPEEYTEVVLKGDPVAIVCQNINNYMGGVANIWRNAKNLGVELHNPQINPEHVDEKAREEEEKKIFNDLLKSEQNFGDGKLEFFGFNSGFDFGLEKIFSGFANKIYQGSGPILLKFKDYNAFSVDDKENRVYLNIDGEYFNLVKAKELRVRSNKKFLDGKVKFLCKK